jgi:hypothetical protein
MKRILYQMIRGITSGLGTKRSGKVGSMTSSNVELATLRRQLRYAIVDIGVNFGSEKAIQELTFALMMLTPLDHPFRVAMDTIHMERTLS